MMEQTHPFSLRGREGTVTVAYGTNDDPERWGYDVLGLSWPSSLAEGLPCARVAAMTRGVPVVATAGNAVPEIVISGKTGLLARPGDPASLSGALAYLLDHPAQAARMAEAARAHIGDRFRPEAPTAPG